MRNLDIPLIVFTSQSEITPIYIGDEDFVIADKPCTIILPEKAYAYTGKVITVIANADCNILNTEIGAMILLPRYRLTVVAIAEQWVVVSLIHVPIPKPIYIENPKSIEEKQIFSSDALIL
jgi:hypothetical protein